MSGMAATEKERFWGDITSSGPAYGIVNKNMFLRWKTPIPVNTHIRGYRIKTTGQKTPWTVVEVDDAFTGNVGKEESFDGEVLVSKKGFGIFSDARYPGDRKHSSFANWGRVNNENAVDIGTLRRGMRIPATGKGISTSWTVVSLE